MCSFWLADALAHIGEVEQAQRRFERLLSFGSPLGLMAEEVDVTSGDLLGNYPQAFTHLALIGAAVNIERARHRRLGHPGARAYPRLTGRPVRGCPGGGRDGAGGKRGAHFTVLSPDDRRGIVPREFADRRRCHGDRCSIRAMGPRGRRGSPGGDGPGQVLHLGPERRRVHPGARERLRAPGPRHGHLDVPRGTAVRGLEAVDGAHYAQPGDVRGRELAIERMVAEAVQLTPTASSAWTSAGSATKVPAEVLEFLAVGTAVRFEKAPGSFRAPAGKPFSSGLSGRDFFKLLRYGWAPPRWSWAAASTTWRTNPSVRRSAGRPERRDPPVHAGGLLRPRAGHGADAGRG